MDPENKEQMRKKELSNLLRAKIGEKQISRNGKAQKEAILDKTLTSLGLDKDKFKADLEAIKKQGFHKTTSLHQRNDAI
jgi:hypothetical protein